MFDCMPTDLFRRQKCTSLQTRDELTFDNMAVLPESGGPTNRRALPLDFVFPRVYDTTMFESAACTIKHTR